MHLGSLTIFALSSLSYLAEAVPFVPRDASLQRHRRRLVDYPVQPAQRQRARSLQKRDGPGYSVVLVNGDGASSSAPVLPAAAIVTTTVTDESTETLTIITTNSAATQTTTEPAKTQTVVRTSTVTETGTAKPVLVTKIQVVTTTQAAPPAKTLTITTTEEEKAGACSTTTITKNDIVTKTLILLSPNGSTIATLSTAASSTPLQSSYPTLSLTSGIWRNSTTPTSTPVYSSSLSTSSTYPVGKHDGLASLHRRDLGAESGPVVQKRDLVQHNNEPRFTREAVDAVWQRLNAGEISERDDGYDEYESGDYSAYAKMNLELDPSRSIHESDDSSSDTEIDLALGRSVDGYGDNGSDPEMNVELGRSIQASIELSSRDLKGQGETKKLMKRREREIHPQYGATDLTRAEIRGLKRFMS